MKNFELLASSREACGTSACRNVRREGQIPANVYGKRNGSRPILLDTKGFTAKASKSRTSQVFTLKSDDKDLDGTKAIVKEIQRNYLNGNVLHVDLLELHDDEEVKVIVPLNITGTAPGVKTQGGILTVSCHNIVVSCLPGNIPGVIEVAIDTLNLGQRIRTGELQLPEGVLLRGNPKETIVSVLSGRASRLAANVEGEGAATESEAGAAAPAAGA